MGENISFWFFWDGICHWLFVMGYLKTIQWLIDFRRGDKENRYESMNQRKKNESKSREFSFW